VSSLEEIKTKAPSPRPDVAEARPLQRLQDVAAVLALTNAKKTAAASGHLPNAAAGKAMVEP